MKSHSTHAGPGHQGPDSKSRQGRAPYGFHHDGTSVAGLPITTGNEIYSTAAAADLDADGDVDVAFASYDANVYVIDFPGASAAAAYEWPTYAGNNFRTAAYRERPCEPPTAVGEPEFRQLALTQSVPNPFASRTSIRFNVPRDMEISLRVYDVGGRLVRTLLDGPEPAGPRTVHWDGRADDGQAAAPGVYFYRLENGEKAITRKSVRLR